MATAEARRRDLYNGLNEVLGTERADTLMAYLPLHTVTELATKDDIARLEARFDGLEARFDGLEARADRLDGKLDGGLASVNQRLDRFFLTQSAGLIAMVGTLIAALLL